MSANLAQVPFDDAGYRLLDGLNVGVVVLDEHYVVTYLNQAGEELAGTTRNRAIGLNIGELFDRVESINALVDRAFEMRGSLEIRELDLFLLSDPDHRRQVDVTAMPIDAHTVVLELRDVAHRLRIDRENELKSQNTVSRTITKQLAHEIKNPLGGLRGAAQLLARRLPTPDLQEYTDVIIHEADRLVHLVDAMLGPNKPTHRESTNLHRVIDHVCTLIRSEAGEGVVVERDYDPSLPKVLIDVDQITQAVLNLARNALQATGEKGRIVFRTRVEPGFTIGGKSHALVARVDLQDSGAGVPQELREQIFYPLVTGRTEGVGLGLAIALDLANRHDGLIKLQSGTPTVFSLYLPLIKEQD
ncbi:MAG: nitrogen regulation protein NR(II) [Gammaproteobacteria bacterium]